MVRLITTEYFFSALEHQTYNLGVEQVKTTDAKT